ncbi:ribosome-associated heat shock protein Hsp15 [Salinimonas chungwhensis]|uniref:ribosome-associated heat shock protein Hsp15 n=1 Tax=Salinimonas chungwhensis TaxID=265425 RepID=UPI00037C9323|nr:ribosome-associated heat shock protein Hsp15 [Salinimonas chungwhensis]
MSQSKQAKSTEKVRLDKWLWAARFFKTRALARDMVQSGKVQYNGQRAKPGRPVEIGAMITLPAGWDHKEVEVLDLCEKRQSASLAQALYSETQASVDKREENQRARQLSAFHSPKPDGRPDKKQRREIIKLKHS